VTTRRQFLGGAVVLAMSGCSAKHDPITYGGFDSKAMNRRIGWGLFRPVPGPLPLLLVLHGKGGNHEAGFRDLRLDRFLRASGQRFAVATVDGGDDSYYHPRRSGISPQRMILDELLPALSEQQVLVDSFAVGGWSMGGYGALLLAELLGPKRIRAVAVDSPALFLSAGATPAGAFDDAEDFHRHDVLRFTSLLKHIPVRVTCGTADPFLSGARRLVQLDPAVQHDFRPGGHDMDFWRGSMPKQLAFVGAHLR